MHCIWWDLKKKITHGLKSNYFWFFYNALYLARPCSNRFGRLLQATTYTFVIRLKKSIAEKRPEYAIRHESIIFHRYNARLVRVRNYLKNYQWKVPAHWPYTPEIRPSQLPFVSFYAKLRKSQWLTMENTSNNILIHVISQINAFSKQIKEVN